MNAQNSCRQTSEEENQRQKAMVEEISQLKRKRLKYRILLSVAMAYFVVLVIAITSIESMELFGKEGSFIVNAIMFVVFLISAVIAAWANMSLEKTTGRLSKIKPLLEKQKS